MVTLSEDRIVSVLQEQGLTRREAEIYIFLSKKGTQNVRFLSANLKIERVQAYRARVEALKMMKASGIQNLAVMKKGKLVGMLTG
jgi:hypothetical protein